MASSSFRVLFFLAVILVFPPIFIPTGEGLRRIFAEAIPSSELEAMEAALRQRGYHLFPNAIMTSDLRLRLLDGTSFTLFAPTDASLFSLDMASESATDYLNSLLFHFSPIRLTLSSLRSLPSPSSFPSLLDASPHHLIHHVYTAAGSDHRSFVSVDGIRIVDPSIFDGPSVAVHGLGGILDFRRSDDGLPPPELDYDPPATDGASPKSPESSPYPQPECGEPSWNPPDAPSPSPQESSEGSDGGSFCSSPSESPVGDYGDDLYRPSYLQCAASSTVAENYGQSEGTVVDVVDELEISNGGEDRGFYDSAVAAGEEMADGGSFGERRNRMTLTPAGPAPSTPFEVISISSEPPMYAADSSCLAVSGEGDNADARSAATATRCALAEAKGQGADPAATAEDIEISYNDALRGLLIQPPNASEDLL